MDKNLITKDGDSLFQLKVIKNGLYTKDTFYIYNGGNRISEFILRLIKESDSDDWTDQMYNIIIASYNNDVMFHDLQIINDIGKMVTKNNFVSSISNPYNIWMYIPKYYKEWLSPKMSKFKSLLVVDDEDVTDKIMIDTQVYDSCGELVPRYLNHIIISTDKKLVSSKIVDEDNPTALDASASYTPDNISPFDTLSVYIFDRCYG